MSKLWLILLYAATVGAWPQGSGSCVSAFAGHRVRSPGTGGFKVKTSSKFKVGKDGRLEIAFKLHGSEFTGFMIKVGNALEEESYGHVLRFQAVPGEP